jgi:hypothetical protein
MLYKVLRNLVLSFIEHKSFGPMKKCFLIRRLAEVSYDQSGLAFRIQELDIILKKAFIPKDLSIKSAVHHALCMDEIWYPDENGSGPNFLLG